MIARSSMNEMQWEHLGETRCSGVLKTTNCPLGENFTLKMDPHSPTAIPTSVTQV